MPHYVKFNVKCGVGGVQKAVDDECHINDSDFKQLSRMVRMGKPYVEEIPEPSLDKEELREEAKASKKETSGKRGKKETAAKK